MQERALVAALPCGDQTGWVWGVGPRPTPDSPWRPGLQDSREGWGSGALSAQRAPETQGSVSRSLSHLAWYLGWDGSPLRVCAASRVTDARIHLVKLVKQLPAPPSPRVRCPGHCGGPDVQTRPAETSRKSPVCFDTLFHVGTGRRSEDCLSGQ